MKAAGGDVVALPADLTKPADRGQVVAKIVERFGGLDVLINGAGVAAYGPFATGTEDVLRTIMEINFFAVAELIRLCQPHLLKSATFDRRPAILNLTSVAGRVGTPGVSEHSASKFALVGLTEALRGEFARYDIDVLMVHPGLVQSDDLDRHLLRGRTNACSVQLSQGPPPQGSSLMGSWRHWKQASGKQPSVEWPEWACFGKRMAPRMVRIVSGEEECGVPS